MLVHRKGRNKYTNIQKSSAETTLLIQSDVDQMNAPGLAPLPTNLLSSRLGCLKKMTTGNKLNK